MSSSNEEMPTLMDLIKTRLRGRKIPDQRLKPLGKWFPRAMRAERLGMIELQKERKERNNA